MRDRTRIMPGHRSFQAPRASTIRIRNRRAAETETTISNRGILAPGSDAAWPAPRHSNTGRFPPHLYY